MKKLFGCLVVFALMCMAGFSQNEAKKWYFSSTVGLDFNTTPPTVVSNGAMTSSVGCSAISNAQGNLLFYTNGTTVWNQTHNVMSNGTGLSGTPGAQNCVIVKKPLSTSLYYIFTVEGGGGASGLSYSIVDMSLSSGNGSVTVKNASLFASPCEEKISAVRHCNQSDVWIMVHKMDTSLFQGYLLTAAGVNSTAVVSNVGPMHSGPSYKGQMKFSPNGKRLAQVYTVSSYSNVGVFQAWFEFYNFDNLTGLLSSYTMQLGFYGPFPNSWGYGAEFSPDGTKFYYTYHGNLVQVDWCSSPPGVNGGIIAMDNAPDPPYSASMQLGTDGKIYVANVGLTSLGVINNPNNTGNACNYQPAGVSLGTYTCQFGLPNFLTSYFEQSPTFTTIPYNPAGCLTVNFVGPSSCAITGYGTPTLNWSFGDPGSGAANTSTLDMPGHLYPSGGTYSVSMIASYPCGRTDTVRKTIVVHNPPFLTVSTPSLSCGPVSASVASNGGIGPYTYTWSPTAQNGTLASNLQPGIYTVQMRDQGTGCAVTMSTNINPVTVNAAVFTNSVCSTALTGSAGVVAIGGAGSFSWSGSAQTTATVSGLAIGNHTVTYYEPVSQCSITRTFEISQMPALSLALVPGAQAECAGKPIILYSGPSGGIPGYSYSWTSGPATDTYVVSQAQPGTYVYTLTVSDSKNCSITNTVSINFIANPVLTFSGNTSCLNTPAQMMAFGASSYTWLPSNFTGSTYNPSPPATTTYTVIGQTGWCVSTATTTLFITPLPAVSLSANTPVCAGQTLFFSGNGQGSFQWAGPAGFSSALQNPSIAVTSGSNSGMYSLSLSANGCSSTTNIAINVYPSPAITITGIQTLCRGEQINLIASGAATYTWNTGSLGPVLTTTAGASSIYTVTGTNNYACVTSKTISVKIFECTGIDELNNQPVLVVYPNPNNGIFTVLAHTNAGISIFNELGELIVAYKIAPGKTIVDLSVFNNGMYLLKCSEGNGPDQTYKIIKHN